MRKSPLHVEGWSRRVHTSKLLRLCSALVVVMTVFSLRPTPTRAAGVVGTGTPASCTERALDSALAGGGTISFNCGGAATITVTSHKVIASTVTINGQTARDGSPNITISGGDKVRLFVVSPGATLSLHSLILTKGYAAAGVGPTPGYGGAIYNQRGTLNISNSTISQSRTVLSGNNAGGGIDNDNGTVTILNSVVEDNRSDYGGGVDSVGTLTISGSIIRNNLATSGLGGGLDVGGTITLRTLEVSQNRAWKGAGGMNITGAGRVVVEDASFLNNTAEGIATANGAATPKAGSENGGAILNAGVLSLTRTTLSGNRATFGGAIGNTGTLSLDRVQVEANRAVLAGGGVYNSGSSGRLTAVASTVERNTTTDAQAVGGGIYNDATTVLERSTVALNTASQGAGIGSFGSLQLTNVTIANNTSRLLGGGVYGAGGTVVSESSTILSNRAPEGGNLSLNDVQTSFHGTIVSKGTCQYALNSAGYNLDDSGTCQLTAATDLPKRDAKLLALNDNGGPTKTAYPAAGSPVIDTGGAQCVAQDQRGFVRPQGKACDIGAVEVEPPVAQCGGVFPAVLDATINSAAADTSYGRATTLHIARQSSSAIQHGLIGFDLTGKLPQNVFVDHATLELPLTSAPAPSSKYLTVRSLTQPWSETVTWRTQPTPGVIYANGGTALKSNILEIDVSVLATQWATGQVSQTTLLVQAGKTGVDLTVKSRESGNGPRLVIACTPVSPAPLSDPTAADTAQQTGIQRLEGASARAPKLQFTGGALTFGDFDVVAPGSVTTPLARAQWWLTTYHDLLRIDQPNVELQLVRRSDDSQHFFFRQLHAGIPVFPSELAVHLSGDHVTGVSGKYVPGIALGPTPLLTSKRADDVARTAIDPAAELLGDTQLRYVNLGLIGNADATTHIAWQVNMRTQRGDLEVFIDARSGHLLFQGPREHEGYDLDLENGNNQPPQNLCGLFDNDNIPTNFDADASRLSVGMWNTYSYWRSTFNRDSYDNDGEQIEANIHVRYAFPNASYSPGCDIFFFGNNMTTLDIAGHEFTHAVVNETAGLIYQGQSGALNESYADIFGHYAFPANWLIGVGSAAAGPPVAGVAGCSATPALRDMSNPPCYGNPDRMSTFVNTTADNGGVHSNSGIHNKAAFLLTDGGSFNGRTVRGIGQSKAQQLFYNTLIRRLGRNSNLLDARNGAVVQAQDFANRRAFGFTAQDVCSVREAFRAVELGDGDVDCNGIEDAIDDKDKDGIPDVLDNCPLKFNRTQADGDGDGIGDACDNDKDNDGIINDSDNCEYNYNPSQRDADRDGIGDACDDDRDGDYVTDVMDNCPNVANADQSDVDRDRVGDACDGDADNDGICDIGGPRAGGSGGIPAGGCQPGKGSVGTFPTQRPADNCPLHANRDQADSDNDGVGDACDLCPGVRSKDNGDPDGDGLGNPCDSDDDNDGVLDYNPDGSQLDNCREVPNPNQLDTDNNGIGFACDPAEIQAFFKRLKESTKVIVHDNVPGRIPIPICPQCGLSYLPENFEDQVKITLPIGVRARVVDSAGYTVARAGATAKSQTISFNPAPFAGLSQRTGAGLAATQATGLTAAQPAASDMFYYLEVQAAPGQDLSKPVPITIEVTENIPSTVLLPLVRR